MAPGLESMKTVMTKKTMTKLTMETAIQILSSKRKNKRRSIARKKLRRSKDICFLKHSIFIFVDVDADHLT